MTSKWRSLFFLNRNQHQILQTFADINVNDKRVPESRNVDLSGFPTYCILVHTSYVQCKFTYNNTLSLIMLDVYHMFTCAITRPFTINVLCMYIIIYIINIRLD